MSRIISIENTLEDPEGWHTYYNGLSDEKKQELARMAAAVPGLAPLPGPQTDAYMSDAKIVGLGGAGGGGKSFLIALLAILKHRHSVVFRYDKAQLGGLINDLVRAWGSSNGLNRGDGVFRFGDDHFMEYGGIGKPLEEENWQGRAHDLIAIDEVTQLTLKKVEYVMGWLRTTVPGLIPKIIMTMNPPRSPTGRWVIPYFAPWLDKAHPDYPAQPGKKYWYYRDEDGEQIEMSEEPEEKIHLRLGDQDFYIEPESKTFFPARVWHNKYLVAAGYQSHLASRPKAERDMLLLGDFQASMQDDDNQLVPTQWVEDSMGRWEEGGHRGEPMDAIGIDVARGGIDLCVFAPRHRLWWDKLVEIEGKNISSGRVVAQRAVELRRNKAKLCVDSIGDGSGTYDMLADPDIYNANPASVKGSVRKNLPKHIEADREFYNLRTVLAWTLRRILDPENGLGAALPPSPKLRDEITAHHYSEVAGITKLEIKDSVKVTLGHSPDHFDSIIYSLFPIAMRHEDIALNILPPKRKKKPRLVTELNLPKHTMNDPYRYLRSHR